MSEFKEGLYDLIVTRRLREFLDGQTDLRAAVDEIEEGDCPDYLARHLVREIKGALRALPATDRKDRQIALANQLVELLRNEQDEFAGPDIVDPAGEVLRSLYRTATPPQHPTTPLAATNLLMNVHGEPGLGFELEKELATSDRVLMVVSFIQWRGWQRLKSAFHELTIRSIPVRILTTTYIGATEFRAVEELSRLPNVELRISLDGRRRRLHAKAWLFERNSGFSTAYVGSANLSGPALEDGIEWTVKLSEVEAPHVLERFRGAFETLWSEPEFEPFHPEDEDACRRVRRALADARSGEKGSAPTTFFDLRPHPYQQATLDRLEAERVVRGFHRNLVVAPTGTGKTLIAAFDYARQALAGPRPRLLFLAHREELLRQARGQFRHVLRDESFGDLLAGGAEPDNCDYLFATIQSLHSRELMERWGSEYWHYAVVDEAHHVPAESYREVVASLRPQILLGLTATPERMDGQSILPWFDNRIAEEMRLWHAIERQYLVPFDYYGVHDGTDLSTLAWSRGAYAVGDLEKEYLGNTRRAGLVAGQFCEVHPDWQRARAIGFCVSVAHAEFMAEAFNRAGIPSLVVTSQSPQEDRRQAPTRLRSREVNALFTVDLFNEGVDIPEVDCILFLRPTESPTVFLQQLGRGLRLDTGKTSCLVLDFIGNQRREFRFDQRFAALLGGTRQQLVRELETGITRLPGNCYFRLDKEARRIVLQNLQTRLKASKASMVAELRRLAGQLARRPTLVEFLAETGYELAEVYKSSVGGWRSLLNETQMAPPLSAYDSELIDRFRFLLHIDSPSRLKLSIRLLNDAAPEWDSLPVAERRMIQMMTFRLLPDSARQPQFTWYGGLERLRLSPSAREEFCELSKALLEGVQLRTDEDPVDQCPLFLHRRYTRDEVLVAMGVPEMVGQRHTQTGRLWLPALNMELLFVTLDKSEKTFSPSTRYEDFAVSPTRFHWQSQSTTAADSATGQRYCRQAESGVRFLLFVRPKKVDAFVFLGTVRYVSHTGSRPMSIYWDLEHSMPASFFDVCASLRAA